MIFIMNIWFFLWSVVLVIWPIWLARRSMIHKRQTNSHLVWLIPSPNHMFQNFFIQSDLKQKKGIWLPLTPKPSVCLNTDSIPRHTCMGTTHYVLPSKSLEKVTEKRKKNIVICSGKERDADGLEIMIMQYMAWTHFWWIRSTDFSDWMGSHWTDLEHAKPQLLIHRNL